MKEYEEIFKWMVEGKLIEVQSDGYWSGAHLMDVLEFIRFGVSPDNFRVAMKTHIMNETVLPAPFDRAPEIGTDYWVIDLTIGNCATCVEWVGDDLDRMYLERGLIFATEESARENARCLIEMLQKGRE